MTEQATPWSQNRISADAETSDLPIKRLMFAITLSP